MSETILGFPMPTADAEQLAEKYDGVEIAMYHVGGLKLGPHIVVNDESLVDTLEAETEAEVSEWEADCVDTSYTADEIRESDTLAETVFGPEIHDA